MTEDTFSLHDAPETCEETTEYDNRIEDEMEIEPEEDEHYGSGSQMSSKEADQTFARYERNFRARRIRELTNAPLIKKRFRADKNPTDIAA